MRDCQETLDKWSENPTIDQDTKNTYVQQSELLYKQELIWNLLEILCIEKNSVILPSLLQWISLHFPKCDEKARNVLGGTSSNPDENIEEYLETPESHPEFWDAILFYILQGRTENARKLLRLHSDFNTGKSLTSYNLCNLVLHILGPGCELNLIFQPHLIPRF